MSIDRTLPRGDPEEAAVDHIIPKVASGTDEIANLQAAHRRCNVDKGYDSQAVYALKMRLRRSSYAHT